MSFYDYSDGLDQHDRVEAEREANEGLAYEEWWENRIRDDVDEDEDPDTIYDNAASRWDSREGK